jgi:hypothetical protein
MNHRHLAGFFFLFGFAFETGSPYIAQASLELSLDPLVSAFQVPRLQVCTTMPSTN